MIGPKQTKPTPAEEREAYATVEIRDAGLCLRCRRVCGPISRDHRKERSRGGLTVIENLQLLRGTGTTGCHGWKTANPRAALEQGWGVPGYAEPAEWPAARWLPTNVGTVRLGWVLYESMAEGAYFREITAVEAMRRMGRRS